MKTPVVILGCGGLGREIAAVLGLSGQFDPVGFYDDGAPVGTRVLNLPVLGAIAAVEAVDRDTSVVFGMANPEVKARIWNRLRLNHHIHFPTVVSEQALLLAPGHMQLGAGTVVMPGAVVGPNVVVGQCCLLHLGCLVSHDTVVGDFSSLLQRSMAPSGGSLPAGTVLRSGEAF